VGVFEAGEGQTEVIEPAVKQLASNDDPRSVTSVKSDNPMRPGGCSWREDHLPIRAVHRSPRPDPPFKRPPRPGAQFRVPTA
jgi:hypothetical protein